MKLRQIIPRPLKIGFQLVKRFVRYRLVRTDLRFARARPFAGEPARITLTQAVRRSQLYENKLQNLRLAGKRIGLFTVQPGEVFSFWRSVGPPTARRGFLPGRNVIGGELREDTGGGLCQLSGLLYHLSLLAGLEIIERHNHSTDIYQEHERFTPLGADAAVVYGYRDLMVRNNTTAAINFSVVVEEERITGSLHCGADMASRQLEFRRVLSTGKTKRVVTVGRSGDVLCRSEYN